MNLGIKLPSEWGKQFTQNYQHIGCRLSIHMGAHVNSHCSATHSCCQPWLETKDESRIHQVVVAIVVEFLHSQRLAPGKPTSPAFEEVSVQRSDAREGITAKIANIKLRFPPQFVHTCSTGLPTLTPKDCRNPNEQRDTQQQDAKGISTKSRGL